MKTQPLIEDLILQHSALRWRICETGAGCPVASALLETPGISKILYDAHVPYGKDAQEDAGYKAGRVISAEFCKKVMERKSNNANANSVYVSTFQVEEDACSHGWIGIKVFDYERYYHVTLGKGMSRREAIRRIGDTGIILMANVIGKRLDVSYVDEPLDVDIVLDGNGNYIWDEMLNPKNNFATILHHDDPVEDVYAERLEWLRVYDNVVIMPGSFNPSHEGHAELMNKTKQWVGNNKGDLMTPIFACITMNNFNSDKNPTAEQIVERASKLLNDIEPLGVIVTDSPRLKDFTKFHQRTGAHLHIPVGWDTYLRMEQNLFSDSRYDCITWHIFDRDFAIKNYRENGTESSKQVIRNLEANSRVVLHEEREHMTINSTELSKK